MSIINNVTGTNININDSNGDRIIDLDLQGNTTQETTPTPSSPVAVNVVSGRQDIEVCKKNLCPTSIDDWESGEYAYEEKTKKASASRIRVKQLIKVNPNTTYYFNTLASNTFLDSPIINLLTPDANISKLCFRVFSSFSIVSYLTIGPAINCGKNVK